MNCRHCDQTVQLQLVDLGDSPSRDRHFGLNGSVARGIGWLEDRCRR